MGSQICEAELGSAGVKMVTHIRDDGDLCWGSQSALPITLSYEHIQDISSSFLTTIYIILQCINIKYQMVLFVQSSPYSRAVLCCGTQNILLNVAKLLVLRLHSWMKTVVCPLQKLVKTDIKGWIYDCEAGGKMKIS